MTNVRVKVFQDEKLQFAYKRFRRAVLKARVLKDHERASRFEKRSDEKRSKENKNRRNRL